MQIVFNLCRNYNFWAKSTHVVYHFHLFLKKQIVNDISSWALNNGEPCDRTFANRDVLILWWNQEKFIFRLNLVQVDSTVFSWIIASSEDQLSLRFRSIVHLDYSSCQTKFKFYDFSGMQRPNYSRMQTTMWTSANILIVKVSSFCDIVSWLKSILPTFEPNILPYSIILKHVSCVSKWLTLSYELRYPISNRCRVGIPYLAMKCHYFANCAHVLRRKRIHFFLHIKLPITFAYGVMVGYLLNYLSHPSKCRTSKLIWYSHFSIQLTTNRCLTYNLASVRMLWIDANELNDFNILENVLQTFFIIARMWHSNCGHLCRCGWW